MKKVIYRTPSSYDYLTDSDMEKPDGESMTLPDQSTSLSEIVARMNAGILPDGGGFYDDESENEDIDNPEPVIEDITDIQEYTRSMNEKYEQLAEDKRLREEEAKRMTTEEANKKPVE